MVGDPLLSLRIVQPVVSPSLRVRIVQIPNAVQSRVVIDIHKSAAERDDQLSPLGAVEGQAAVA